MVRHAVTLPGLVVMALVPNRKGAQAAYTLLRTRDTPAQAGLNRAGRLHNLAGAFAVNRPVEGRFIVLIDDVSTTGATLAEAAQSLARQGARRVEAWALMKALTHGA